MILLALRTLFIPPLCCQQLRVFLGVVLGIADHFPAARKSSHLRDCYVWAEIAQSQISGW